MAPEKSLTRNEARILLVPTTSRDAEAVVKVLKGVRIECDVFSTIAAVCEELPRGIAVLLVAEEALKYDHEPLGQWLAAQPMWSDLPIIVLSRSGMESPKLTGILSLLGNVSVLERPVRVSTLLSLVQASVRARLRQYQTRDHVAEREQLFASERQARSEIERASRIKDEFLATLSHELRTPLSAILGWSHILSMPGVSTADIGEGVKVIERNARVQTQIIEDLLDMSRIISGKIRLDVQAVDLSEVVQAAVDTVRTAADAKGVRIRLVLDPLAGKVSGDPNRLQQILWNLLSNAVKFTPKGGLVQVLLERTNSHLTLSVIDSGQGIAAEFLPHVFDRFRQADSTTTRQHGGLGLGLAIVKQLVELHGGLIRATSEGAGRGALFSLILPLRVTLDVVPEAKPKADQANPKSGSSDSSDVSFAGLKILVVDDEPDARNLLKRLLEDRQAEVYVCDSTVAATEVLKAERPHVIVSDIGMPHEDGYSFIRRVRRLSAELGGSTPAVALTAYARAEDRVTAIRAGFQHHLTKPVESAELIAIVASLAGR